MNALDQDGRAQGQLRRPGTARLLPVVGDSQDAGAKARGIDARGVPAVTEPSHSLESGLRAPADQERGSRFLERHGRRLETGQAMACRVNFGVFLRPQRLEQLESLV